MNSDALLRALAERNVPQAQNRFVVAQQYIQTFSRTAQLLHLKVTWLHNVSLPASEMLGTPTAQMGNVTAGLSPDLIENVCSSCAHGQTDHHFDNCGGINPVMSVEVANRTRLAKMLDP